MARRSTLSEKDLPKTSQGEKPLPPVPQQKMKSRQTLLQLGAKKTSSTRMQLEIPAPSAAEPELPVVYCKIECGRGFNFSGGFLYCSLKLEELGDQTNYVLADREPCWDEEFVLVLKQKMSCLEITMFAVDEEGHEASYVGEVNVPIHMLSSHKLITDWFPVQAGNVQQGELRVVLYNSLQRSAMDALRELEEIYAQFLAIVSAPDDSLLTSLFDLIDPSDADRVGTSVVSIFSYLGRELDLFQQVIQQEVEGTSSVTVLFRSNSMAIRLVSMYAKLLATPFLKILLSPLIEETLSGDPARFEVDPARLGGAANAMATAKKNQKTLQDMVCKYLDAIFGSLNRVPRVLRRIASMFVETVEVKFPGASEKAVGGFFFLRFICPAIVAPATFGLLQKHPSGAAHRALVLVAKVLQNAANATQFKEAEMESFNSFLVAKQADFEAFLKALGQPSSAEGEQLNILRPAVVADSCIVLAKLFRQHLPSLRTEDRPNRAAVSDELEKVLKDLAANELVQEKPYNMTLLEEKLRKDGIAKVQKTDGSSDMQEDEEGEGGILNIGRVWQKPFHPACARDLAVQALSIFNDEIGKASSKSKSSMDWSGISKSNAEFKKFEIAVCELQKADLNLMLSQQQKQAFWLNIYHALLLHVLFVSGPPTSAYAKKLFFSNFRYRIGPYVMSLLDIEIGIIRGNPVLKGSSRQWSESDRRRALSLTNVETNVLLAMGSLSSVSPVMVAYSAQSLDAQLNSVVGHFLNAVVEIDAAKRDIYLPKQFSRINLSPNALLTWLYPFLGARKKLDVLYLQSKSFNVVVAKTAGKLPSPKVLLSWIESFKSSASVEELPEVFPQSSASSLPRTSSLLSPLTTPSATPSATPTVSHLPVAEAKNTSLLQKQNSQFDENIMRDSLSTMVEKVIGQLYDNSALAQSIYAEVSKSVSVTIAFQTGKVIREIKMQLLDVDGITWTSSSLEKFKQEVPMETPVLTRLQKLQVSSEQKQEQILKLLGAIQTAVVDIRFLLESVVAALQKAPSMAVALGRISASIKERLQSVLERILEKNSESAEFESLITLESAIAPEIDALIALLRMFREQITAANQDTKKGRVMIFSLTAILNWVRNQLDPSKAQTAPFKMQVFDETQLMSLPRGKVQEVVGTVLSVIDVISGKFRHMMASLLTTEYGTKESLYECAMLIRSCRNALLSQTEQT